jgi:hypothetical protein
VIPLGVLASARVAAAGGATFEFLGAASPASAATTHTFAAMPLGSAAADRTILVCVVTQSPISSVTVAGVAATKDIEHAGPSGTRAFLWRATVPTGTNGDVVVVIGSSSTRCGVGLYRIGGAVTVASTGLADPAALTVAAGDFAVACAYSTSASATWTGGTRDYILSFSDYHTGASATAASAGTLTLDVSSSLACAGAAYRLT